MAVAGLAAWKVGDIGKAAEKEAQKDINTVSSGVDSFLHPHKGEDLQPQGSVEVSSIKPRVLSEIDSAYPNLNQVDRRTFVNSLARFKSLIEPDITSEIVERIIKIEPQIKDFAGAFGVPEDLLRGLVIWESKGDSRAVSYDSNGKVVARGLTQMKDDMANSLGLKVTNDASDERYDADKILKATAKELKSRFDNFGDWGLALWSWHAGEPRVYDAVRAYMIGLGLPLEDVNVRVKDDSEGAKAEATIEAMRRKNVYRQTIQDKSINLFKLFQSQKVKDMFNGPGWDSTDEYVPRIIASSRIYKDQKELLGLAA